MTSQIIPDHTNKLKFSRKVLQPTLFFVKSLSIEALNSQCLSESRSYFYTWRAAVLANPTNAESGIFLEKANNTQKKLIFPSNFHRRTYSLVTSHDFLFFITEKFLKFCDKTYRKLHCYTLGLELLTP